VTTLAEHRLADFRHGRPPSPPEPVMDQLRAEAEHRRAVAEFRARRHADEQARIGALLLEVIAALAPLLDEDAACEKCAGCMRALAPRRRNCPHCGARQPGRPAVLTEAEQHRVVLAEALRPAA
jgi:hypothetical protein